MSTKSIKRKCHFNDNLAKEFSFLLNPQKNEEPNKLSSEVYCTICKKIFSIANGGRSQIKQHCKTTRHRTKWLSSTGGGGEDDEGKGKVIIKLNENEFQVKEEKPENLEEKEEDELVNDWDNQLSYDDKDEPVNEKEVILSPLSLSRMCFICGEDKQDTLENVNINLTEQIFLLRDILKVADKPEDKHFLLCEGCLIHVRKGLQIKEQIAQLELSLKLVQSLILAKVPSDRFPLRSSNSTDKQNELINEDHFEDESAYQLEEPSSSLIFYCGLCTDKESQVPYQSKQLLEEHTKQAHRQLPLPKKKPRRGKARPPKDLDCDDKKDCSKVQPKVKESPSYSTYDCPSCPQIKGYYLNAFAQHLQIHQKLPYNCLICSQFLPDNEALRQEHLSSNHPNSEVISSSFSKWNGHPGDIWKCQGQRCKSTGFPTAEKRNLHEAICIHSKYNRKPADHHLCPICSVSFQNLDEWRLHRVLEHPEIDKMSCFYCPQNFQETTSDGLATRHDSKLHDHMKASHSPAIYINFGSRLYELCESCGLVFNNSLQMKAHFLQKHNIPPTKAYICRLCSHSVSTAHNLRHHLTFSHFLSEHSTICDVCGVSFVHWNSLLDHKLQEHNLLPENPPQALDFDKKPHFLHCPVPGCHFKCLFKFKMFAHRRTHRARNLICRFCGKLFNNTSYLRNHEQIHLNKESRPFKCKLCDSSFAVKNYLYSHIRMTHEKRPFPSTGNKKPSSSKKISH